MTTRHAETESAMDRLRADMAQLVAEAAKRETRLILAIAAMIALATAVMGVIITAG